VQPFKKPLSLRRRARVLQTTPERSALMAAVRQTGTTAELTVRRIARSLGIRYTLSNRDLPGSPDLANRSRRFAVLVHGCFWHRHADCAKTTTPRRNRSFWLDKFDANMRRDARTVSELRRLGYRVIVIWECEVSDQERVARRLRPLQSDLQEGAL